MKQLPRIAGVLYGQPWAIVPTSHLELSRLYQAYIRGQLPAAPQPTPATAEVGDLTVEMDPSGVWVISASGIVGKRITPDLCGPSMIDLALLDRILDSAAVDQSVHTVVLDISTPGGTMVGLAETSEKIRTLSAAGKRTVAYTDTECCSAGYWLAAACDEFYAAPSAAIGSIGVYCAGIDESRAWEMEGIELIMAKSGELKGMGHPGKKWTAEERAHLQSIADSAGASFRAWVRERRGPVPESAMQGQWTAAASAHPTLLDGIYNDLTALLTDLIYQPAI